jgi:hypothetical protein
MPKRLRSERLASPTRAQLRAGVTLVARIRTGMLVWYQLASHKGKSNLKRAVSEVAKATGMSEAYVWRTTKLGKQALGPGLVKQRGHTGQLVSATCGFLMVHLWNERRPAKHIEELARRNGFSFSTLQRASRELGVIKRRRGGRHGHWTWELSADDRKMFE